MTPSRTPNWMTVPRLLMLAFVTLLLLGLGALAFAWSGLYSVAASEGHLAIVDKFLRFGMQSSVRTNARDIVAPDLSDPDLLPLGAAHYYSGCMPCHGAPGHASNATFQQSLPSPPDLSRAREIWRDRELYWLIKHGLKYTGMPGWSARDRNDEQWAVVAFLKRMPDLSKAKYEALALGGYDGSRIASEEPAKTLGTDIALCGRCHGDQTSDPTSNLIPRLHGQSEAYLVQALNDYATGARQSGVMQPIASTLSAEQKRLYAQYYAGVGGISRETTQPTARGEATAQLALSGDPRRGIPACDSCHGASRHQTYPGLAGQSQAYLASQLRLWRDGIPRSGPLAGLMAPIAAKLSDKDIEELAAHYAISQAGAGDVEAR